MRKEIKKAPTIRFRGFTEDWEQRKVTELGEVYIGLVTTMTAHYTNEGTLLIRNSDIKDGKFEFDTEPIYLDKEFAEQNKSRMHKVGDVITVHTGDVGTSAVITENEANSIGFATIVTRPNQKLLDSYYLSTFLNTEKHKAWAVQMSTGDGRTNYNLRDYTELVVPVPKLEEQKKIASYISSLNNLITLHQRKFDELKTAKTYFLQNMFPAKGEKVPRIRFHGFTGDWEQRKFGDVFTERSEKKHESLPPLTIIQGGGTIRRDKMDRKLIYDKKSLTNYKLVRKNDFIVHLRSFEGGLEKSDIEGIVSPAYHIFYGKNINPEFYYNFFRSSEFIKHKLVPFVYGIRDGRSIDIAGMKTIKIPSPSFEEQEQIGNYFHNLDNLITLHQRKLDQLKTLKKFMLQNLLI